MSRKSFWPEVSVVSAQTQQLAGAPGQARQGDVNPSVAANKPCVRACLVSYFTDLLFVEMPAKLVPKSQ